MAPQEPAAHPGTQGETEAGVGHAVRRGAVTVEGIVAPAQDAATAQQNKQDGTQATGRLDQAMEAVPTTVAAAPLLTEDGQGPGLRAVTPRGPNLLKLPQPRGRALDTTAGAAAAPDPAALTEMETKAWFLTEM